MPYNSLKIKKPCETLDCFEYLEHLTYLHCFFVAPNSSFSLKVIIKIKMQHVKRSRDYDNSQYLNVITHWSVKDQYNIITLQ